MWMPAQRLAGSPLHGQGFTGTNPVTAETFIVCPNCAEKHGQSGKRRSREQAPEPAQVLPGPQQAKL